MAALAAIAFAPNANALTINFNPMSPAPVLFGDDNSNAAIIAAIEAAFPGLDETYKQNVGGTEEGSSAGWYTTTFTDAGPHSGTVEHDVGDPFINSAQKYFLLKDGNDSPNWFLFDISSWNGTETIEFNGFFPNHSISHISIFAGGTPTVPDGGTTVALLGLVLGALAFVRSRLT